jgi:hypothetical protein
MNGEFNNMIIKLNPHQVQSLSTYSQMKQALDNKDMVTYLRLQKILLMKERSSVCIDIPLKF